VDEKIPIPFSYETVEIVFKALTDLTDFDAES
jgi:hypothetical protein